MERKVGDEGKGGGSRKVGEKAGGERVRDTETGVGKRGCTICS